MKEWIFTYKDLPEKMEYVLIQDTYGRIRKAFINLGGIWIVQNTQALSSVFYKDDKTVIAWTTLPKVYKKYSKQGWIRVDKKLPPNDIPVLVSTKDNVFISYCRSDGAAMWWLRNSEDRNAEKVYLSRSDVLAWMFLPEYNI